MLQDGTKPTSHGLFKVGEVVLLSCFSFKEAVRNFKKSSSIKCTSNANCTNPGKKCLTQSNPYMFHCGAPIINMIAKTFHCAMNLPPPPPPPPPPPMPSPLLMKTPGNHDGTCDLSFNEAFPHYWKYIGPEDGCGISYHSSSECPVGQSSFLVAKHATFSCRNLSHQDHLVCNEVP